MLEGYTWEQLVSNGIFACLFVYLLLDTRKDSKNREARYQEIISTLSDKLVVIEEIKESIDEIRRKM